MSCKPEEELYFPIYLSPYKGIFPAFYNKENIEACQILEENYTKIQSELNAFLQKESVSREKRKFRYYQAGWNTIMLLNYMLIADKHYHHFPDTLKALSKIDGITLAYFSILSPNTVIPEHNGDTNATYRIHLGISIPDSDPSICGLAVDYDKRAWENGKTLVFCDAHLHSAWNNTDKTRIVLIVDVLRKDYSAEGFLVCAKTLASLGISRLAGPFTFIRSFPKPLIRLMHNIMTMIFCLILYFNRILYFKNHRHALQPVLVCDLP